MYLGENPKRGSGKDAEGSQVEVACDRLLSENRCEINSLMEVLK